MEKGIRTVLYVLLALYVTLVIVANRAQLFSRFDESYWQDKYEQSHWKLPLSPRVIGDDGLYLYEGYRLIHGGDLLSANAEVPPLGKYLIGASIMVFGNGYLYGFFVTSLLVLLTFFLARKLFRGTVPALWISLLLITDPLITNQFTLTMMDALQALFAVLFFLPLLSLTSGRDQRNLFIFILSGVALGLFAEVKLPLFAPLLGGIGLIYIWRSTKKVRFIAAFVTGVAAGYLIPYTWYFLQGHTGIEWLKLQKWMISFYRGSSISPTWGSSIATLFTGQYQNLFTHFWERASEWSPSWGLIFLLTIAAFVMELRKKNRNFSWLMISGTAICMILVYAAIPFWTRYLVLAIPFLYVAGFTALSSIKRGVMFFVLGTMIFANVASSLPILFPPATNTVNLVMYEINNKFFADLYEHVSTDTKKKITRDAFREQGMNLMEGGEIEQILLDPIPGTSEDGTSFTLQATATFFTRRLGQFTQPVTIPFVREHNRWKIAWKWDMLIPGYIDGAKLETSVTPAKRGAIVGSDKKPLAEDVMGSTVWVTPGLRKQDEEEKLLTLLETIFGGSVPKVAIHQRIVGNTRPNVPVAIGVMPHGMNDPNIAALATVSGITFTPSFTRVTYPNAIVDIGKLHNTLYDECCSYLYSTNSYDGISGVEKIKNNQLKGYNGGSIVLKDASGKVIRTLVTGEAKDGADVQP
jgi:hypothetical protein